jgi:hypothetical protein
MLLAGAPACRRVIMFVQKLKLPTNRNEIKGYPQAPAATRGGTTKPRADGEG